MADFRFMLAAGVCAMALVTPLHAQTEADTKADAIVKQMTLDEKIGLVFGHYGTVNAKTNPAPPVKAIPYSAGFVYGVPRLGVPDQTETDAGLGVATHRTSPDPRPRTALPSNIATAATWNPAMAYAGGTMIGNEARLSGFNVQLAAGINLLREPRNGRNFEYAGEDPLLAGTMVGQEIKGIQSNHIVSTVKHYAFNDQETERFTANAIIEEAAARSSDLLAFQLAIEAGDPGSVMCSYNRIDGAYGCENAWLLNDVLKKDWGFKGYVMSDWGATHSTIPAALNGLDQESAGASFDKSSYFDAALKEAVENGHVPMARLDDMVHRIVRTLIAEGVANNPVDGDQSAKIDFAAHAHVTLADSEEGIVLLKNSGVLPLKPGVKSIVVIGGHADKGVLSGGGSSQVYPVGGAAIRGGPDAFPGPMVYYPSSPVDALRDKVKVKISYIDGSDLKAAADAARHADVVLVFGVQWMGESLDAPNLSLPDHQDALITAVAAANRKTVVVLETGGPVTMPWLDKVAGVVEAWYPGTSGGEAIARVLTGEVDPSGHLPATFPVSEAQLPRPVLDGDAVNPKRVDINYNIEGAAVGYKWYDRQKIKPLFPFGYGLSYTTFAYSELKAVAKDGMVSATFTVTNTGQVAGQAVPQIYISPNAGGWEAPKRLGGWDKVALKPGESRTVSVSLDPRLLATFDAKGHQWSIAAGDYSLRLSSDAETSVATASVHLDGRTFAAGAR